MLIYIHKEQELDDVERLYPAKHYVLIDDKLRILDAMKRSGASASPRCFRGRDITRLIPKALANYPPADIQVERIGDLVKHDLAAFAPNRSKGAPAMKATQKLHDARSEPWLDNITRELLT